MQLIVFRTSNRLNRETIILLFPIPHFTTETIRNIQFELPTFDMNWVTTGGFRVFCHKIWIFEALAVASGCCLWRCFNKFSPVDQDNCRWYLESTRSSLFYANLRVPHSDQLRIAFSHHFVQRNFTLKSKSNSLLREIKWKNWSTQQKKKLMVNMKCSGCTLELSLHLSLHDIFLSNMQRAPLQLHVLKCSTRKERLQANEPYRKDLSSRNPGIVEREIRRTCHARKGPRRRFIWISLGLSICALHWWMKRRSICGPL